MSVEIREQLTGIHRFCFGCEPLGGTDWGQVDVNSIEEAINIALDAGVNFFDTSDVYGLGESEKRLSEILGNRRHDVNIATKGGVAWTCDNSGRAKTRIDGSANYVRDALHKSLRRLSLDRIPIYYIHWPDPHVDVGVTVNALYEQQQKGKIGHIACSNFSAKQLTRALEFAPIRFLQMPVNILEPSPDEQLTALCQKNHVGIVAYNVLASGLLTGKYDQFSVFSTEDRRSRLPQFSGQGFQTSLRRLEDISMKAADHNVTVPQYCIGQVLLTPQVEAAIVGIKRRPQLEENIKPFLNKKDI